MSESTSGEAAWVTAAGDRSAALGGNNLGVVNTGDGASFMVAVLGPLPPVDRVLPTARSVGVPGSRVFVGRRDELAQLHAALRAEGMVVVCAVAGLGGIGKSTLVARYAMEHATEYTQVVWVNAENAVSLEAGLTDFELALEPQLARTVPGEGLVRRALEWLATHRDWLLVLDNVADPGLVRDLLPRLGAGRVVVTSRRATGWAGIAEPLRLDVLEAGAARALVHRMSGRTALAC